MLHCCTDLIYNSFKALSFSFPSKTNVKNFSYVQVHLFTYMLILQRRSRTEDQKNPKQINCDISEAVLALKSSSCSHLGSLHICTVGYGQMPRPQSASIKCHNAQAERRLMLLQLC